MRARRRTSSSDLPHAPLLMLHPLAVPGAQVPGQEIVRELRTPVGALLYALHWAALSWSYSGTPAPQLAEVERDALARMGEGECWAAIAILAGQLAGTEPADPSEMAQACFCIAEWALARAARETALAFTTLAALVFPRHPRYAWAAGRLQREYGKLGLAEVWFRRAHRIAVWTRDSEARVRSIVGLAHLSYTAGNWKRAKSRLARALELARRHQNSELIAETMHSLFAIAAVRGEFGEAEEYGLGAAERYGEGHRKLPALAFDFAVLWMNQGYFARALTLLRQIRPLFNDAGSLFQVFAATARAGGSCGEAKAFEEAWTSAWSLDAHVPSFTARAGCLLDLGLGASSLQRWVDARSALEAAIEAAGGAHADVRIAASAALDRVSRHERAEKREPLSERDEESVSRLATALLTSAARAAPEL